MQIFKKTIYRLRKIERIAQLDSEVSQLKEQNVSLVQVKEQLKKEAELLKAKLKTHTDSGCEVCVETEAWEGKKPDSTC